MNAENVIAEAMAEYDIEGPLAGLPTIAEMETERILRALRAACGGGDIVIRADGTLAKLRFDGTVESSGHWVPLIAVVPVERGA